MKTISVTDFKAHALEIIRKVARTNKPVLLTKRGKPLAEVIPFSENRISPGGLSETLVFEKDIVSPLGEDLWEAAK